MIFLIMYLNGDKTVYDIKKDSPEGGCPVAIPQGRHFNTQDIQSVIQILSEVTHPDSSLKKIS